MKLGSKKKFIFVTLFALVFLIILSIVVLHTPLVKSRILKYALNKLEQKQRILLNVQSFDYNLLKLQFTFRGVVIKSLAKDNLPPLFQADEIKIKIPLALILGGNLHIQELNIQNCKIDVRIDQSGKSNIPFQAGSKKANSGRTGLPEFIINRFILQNALIFYSNQNKNIKCEIPAIQMRLGWLGGGRHYLNLEMGKRGALFYQEVHYPMDALRIKAELDYKGIDFEEFNLRSAENEFNFIGRLDNFSSPSLKAKVQGKVNLDSIRSTLPVEKALSGIIHFRSVLQGPLDSVNAEINLQSRNIQFKTLRDIDLEADLIWEDNLLSMTSLHIKVKEGEMQGRGEFHPLDWKARHHLSLRWKSMNLEPFKDFLNLPYYFSSNSSGTLKVSWADFSLKDVKGRAEIWLYKEKQIFEPHNRIPLSGHIISEAESGKLLIDIQDLSIPGAEMQGGFRLGDNRISGKFKIIAKDLKDLVPYLPLSSLNLSERDFQKFAIDGQLLISGELKGTLISPRIKTELKSNNISIQNLRGVKLEGELIYEPHLIRVDHLLIQEGNCRIKISGLYPLSPFGKSMHFDISGKELALEKILKAFDAKVIAKGKVEWSASVRGELNAPIADVSLRVSEGSFFDEKFDSLVLEASYKNEEIRLQSLRVLKDKGKIEVQGRYNLKQKKYNANLSINSLNLQGLKIPQLAGTINTTVDLNLKGSGTLQSPTFEANGSLKRLVYGLREVGDLYIQANTHREELKFQVMVPLYSIRLGGSLRLKTPLLLNAILNVNNLPIEILSDRLLLQKKYRLFGNLTSTVDLNLDLNHPEETLNIQAQLEEFHLKTGSHQFKNEGTIIISCNKEAFRIKNLLLVGTGTEIQAEGYLPLKFSPSEGLKINGYVDLSFISNFLHNIDGRGILKFNSQVTGAVSDLELSADLDLADAKLILTQFPLSLEDIRLHFKVVKNMMSIESFSFRLDESQYQLGGKIPLEALPVNVPGDLHAFGKREVDILFTCQNFDPSVLTKIIPGELFQQISGQIGGRIEVKGQFLRLGDLSAEANFDLLELNIYGIPLLQEEPSHIILDKEKIFIQRLILSGEENRLSIRGSADITGTKPLDVFLSGQLELKVLRALMIGATFAGRSLFEVHLFESLDNPKMQGFIEIQDGSLRMVFPRLSLDQLNGRIQLDQNRIRVEKIQGDLNGGKIELNGDIGFSQWSLSDAEITLRNESALFDFPKDLYSQISSELKFVSDGEKHFLNGTITFVDAKYTEQLRVESAIFRYLRRGAGAGILKEPNEILSHLYLNVTIVTTNKFLIDNNISKSELTANLKLTGTIYNPALAGRAEIEEGGEIYFSQNTFHIERGAIDFINPNRIEPDLNLMARTRVDEYDIQLLLAGTPDRLSANLASDPYLSEPNIISLLVTGRTLESASASVLSVAGNRALSYINSALTGKIEQAAGRSLGLESVRIDASLVSTEENPGARITVGQHLIRDLELVFSQDLKDAQNRTWIMNYNPIHNINLKGVKRDNNSYNFGLQHELRFGLEEKQRQKAMSSITKKDLIVEKIRLEGHLGLSEKNIRKQIKPVEGKRFNFYKFQESLDRIRRFYSKNNYLGYTLKTKREEMNGRLSLIFHIDSGPKIILRYKGGDVPKKLKKEIIDVWIGTSFSQLVLEDIKQRLRLHFFKKRFYKATIHSEELNPNENEKVIVFQISKGVRYRKPHIVYDGNRFFSGDELTKFLRKNHLISDIFVNSRRVTRNIENFYAKSGYLRAKVYTPTIGFNTEKRTVFVNFVLEEGPQFKVGQITVNDARFFGKRKIIDEINIHPGDIVSPEKLNEAHFKIRESYVQKGFNDARVQSQVQIHRERGLIDLIFDIDENQQGKVAEILISGNSLTRKNVIQRELLFKEGDVVHFQTINETRKRLYDLGIFERVNIEVIPIHQDEMTSSEGMGIERERPYRVEIDVVEFKPYRMRYGLQFDTESSFGGSGDLVNRNFLGNAQLLGTSFRINRDERDIRGIFRSSYFFSEKINTEFFTFFNRRIKPWFTVDRIGFTFQQQIELNKSYILNYNYTLERNHTFDSHLKEVPTIDTTIHVGSINAALTRDTRDNILNASRGMFLSQNIGYATKFLGSDVRFIRLFDQYYAFKELTNSLIYASGLRVGLSKGLGQDLIPSERFFAGGGTTIRGFGKDEIGPKDPQTKDPLGGEAVFILNQELRFPIYKKLSGVVFMDFGNVYARVSDFDPFDVRKAAGFGLRFHTSFALFRFDWGFKLDRRRGESLSKIFFSIGQAF